MVINNYQNIRVHHANQITYGPATKLISTFLQYVHYTTYVSMALVKSKVHAYIIFIFQALYMHTYLMTYLLTIYILTDTSMHTHDT